VIDRDLARAWFGSEDPIGRNPPWGGDGGAEESRRYKVVGLIDDYRKDGELAGQTNFMHRRLDLEDPGWPFEKIVFRLAGPPPAGFDEGLLARLQRLAPAWSFDLHAMEDVRASRLRGQLIPLVTLGVLAGFLLLMVGLGLVGVMWQNVTQRTREIGLRRATGASAAAIRRQVLGEMLLLAGFGVACGVIVIVQLPVLGWFPVLGGGLIGSGLVAAAALIAALTLLCGVVPSRLATAVHPAEALHYE
jgi:putative ABC transport system permease protein